MEEVLVKNGKYKIIFSKRYLLACGDPIEMDYKLEDGYPISFSFKFVNTDEKKPNFRIDTDTLETGFKFRFILENFNNALGTGTVSPISILTKSNGTDKKDIYVGFFAFKCGNSNHILDLNIYEEI